VGAPGERAVEGMKLKAAAARADDDAEQAMQSDGDQNIQQRPHEPSSEDLDVPRDMEGAPVEAGSSPDQLHVCFHCAGELAYPLDWCEEGPRHWRIVLRCPDCESLREGVFEQAVVERLDDELDRGASALLADLRRITHANMTDEMEFFVRALQADLIGPGDF
jgi:hypothetical protein